MKINGNHNANLITVKSRSNSMETGYISSYVALSLSLFFTVRKWIQR